MREVAGFPIAGSETHRNRWQAEAMLKAGVVDLYQPESGATCITETMRISRLVADYGEQMVPHGGYLPTMHVAAALQREMCPCFECLWNWNEYGQWVYREKRQPANGAMPPPPVPGLVLELDDDRIQSREVLEPHV